MLNWMANYKVGSRIYAGFALVLALLLALAFTGYNALSGAAGRSDDYARFAGQVEDIKEIQATVADLRRNVRVYTLTGDEAMLKLGRDGTETLKKALREARDSYKSEKRKAEMGQMIALADDYTAKVGQVAQMRKARDENVATMSKAGEAGLEELEKVINLLKAAHDLEGALEAQDLQSEWVEARLDSNKFLLASSKESAAAGKAQVDRVLKMAAALAGKVRNVEAQRLMKGVLDLGAQYDRAFATAIASVSEVDQLAGTVMPKLAADFAAIGEKLGAELSQEIRRLSEENVTANASAVRLLITVALLAVVLGVLFAWAIARGISTPVVDMTDAMTRLAGGDNGVQVPALGNKDEIGEMAKAVQVFKQNAIDKLRMEAEQRAAEEAQRKAEEEQRAREAAIVAEVAEVAKAASGGDLDRRIDLNGKDGFLLTLCDGINGLLTQTSAALTDVAGVLGSVAQGDLTKRISAEYGGLFGQLKTDVNGTADKLFEIVTNINRAAAAIAGAASEVAAGSQDLSERSEQQASNLEETAASMEELAATVRQNSANAQQANQLAAGAREVAASGGQVVANAVDAMGRIESSSQKIGDIVGMIDEIAFQTNLLALNAAVEAARAGDAGKGFAVVAQEVRNLAQRSAQASKEIKTLISESTVQVNTGADLVKGAGKTLDEILGSVKRVADIVAEIAAASQEQASGIDQVNSAVTQMDEMTQQNAALVEESAAAAHSLEEQSRELNRLMGFFQVGAQAQGAVEAIADAPARSAPKAATKPLAKAKPAARPVAKPKAATAPAPTATAKTGGEDDWAEF